MMKDDEDRGAAWIAAPRLVFLDRRMRTSGVAARIPFRGLDPRPFRGGA
jgi:hypothetical protein